MKRTIICIMGLAALVGAYLASRALAQVPGSMGPAATKVGVVNIGTVFQKYGKVAMFREEFERDLKPFKEEEEKLKKLGIQWQTAIMSGKLKPEEKTAGEKTLVDIKRRLEDLKRLYQDKVAKKTEEQLVQLYQEVNDQVGKYAASQGFHLILAYGEPVDGNVMSFVNITRKMQAMDQGGVIPMYFSGSLDISQPVIDNLNRGLTVRPNPLNGNLTGRTTP